MLRIGGIRNRSKMSMKSQIRHLVADALYPTKAYSLPAVCERYGLEPGDTSEAFSSKTQYVMRRLEKLSDEKVVDVARSVIRNFLDDKLQRALEELEEGGHLVSDITRHNLAEALNAFSLGGKRSLMEMLRKFWPSIDHTGSQSPLGGNLADDIERHVVLNDDWENAELLERVGFFTCSQARILPVFGGRRSSDPS